MAKFIDVEEAITELKTIIEQRENFSPRLWPGGRSVTALKFVIGWLEKRPVVDAAPVVRGRWVVTKVNGIDSIFTCSECSREVEATNDYFGKPTEHIAKIYPYCHCGAKMDGDGNG